jgi:ribosomal protein L29
MKLRELKDKPREELRKLLAEERERVRALRFAVATSQESKVRTLRQARKTVARILTLLKAEDKKNA